MTRTQAAFGFFVLICAAMVMMLVPQRAAEATRAEGETKIATVDLMALLEDGLGSTEFAPSRITKRDELAAQVNGIEAQLQQLEQELRLMPQNDPRGQQLLQQYQAGQRQYQQVGQAASAEFQNFSAAQTAQIFNRVREAAMETARSMGYTHVIAARGEIASNADETLATITQEVLARPMLMSPIEDDITDEVRTTLAFVPNPEESAEGEDAESDPAAQPEAP